MMDADDLAVKRYMDDGKSYHQACALVGVRPIEGRVEEVVDDVGGMSDEDLVELNGSLAIRAIHKALTSNKIDNTLIQAAIRAVQMLEAQREVRGSNDPADDMLSWVANIREEKNGG